MYSKEVTAIIMQDWGKGASAEETRKHLTDVFGKAPCLNTIYTHRNGLTTKNLIDELINQQQRDITKQQTSNPELALRFRDSLIKTLVPQMSINLNKNINENRDTAKIDKENQELITYSRVFNASVETE